MALLQETHDLPKRNGISCSRQPDTAAGAPLRDNKPTTYKILHDLREVIVRNLELSGDLSGCQRLVWRVGETH